MSREKRLLLRLERQEKATEEALALLKEAQKGFLRELGWVPLPSEEYWSHPEEGVNWELSHAVLRAKQNVRGVVRG
jgi:hypothetical protein